MPTQVNMLSKGILAVTASFICSTQAQSVTAVVPTAVTSCHAHGATQYCMYGTAEYEILTAATRTVELPARYTGCHSHGIEM